jgi:hypothetical protein
MEKKEEMIWTYNAELYKGKRIWFIDGKSVNSGIPMGIRQSESEFNSWSYLEISVLRSGGEMPQTYTEAYVTEEAALKALKRQFQDHLESVKGQKKRLQKEIKKLDKEEKIILSRLEKM